MLFDKFLCNGYFNFMDQAGSSFLANNENCTEIFYEDPFFWNFYNFFGFHYSFDFLNLIINYLNFFYFFDNFCINLTHS
jgi:hypothetical protein